MKWVLVLFSFVMFSGATHASVSKDRMVAQMKAAERLLWDYFADVGCDHLAIEVNRQTKDFCSSNERYFPKAILSLRWSIADKLPATKDCSSINFNPPHYDLTLFNQCDALYSGSPNLLIEEIFAAFAKVWNAEPELARELAHAMVETSLIQNQTGTILRDFWKMHKSKTKSIAFMPKSDGIYIMFVDGGEWLEGYRVYWNGSYYKTKFLNPGVWDEFSQTIRFEGTLTMEYRRLLGGERSSIDYPVAFTAQLTKLRSTKFIETKSYFPAAFARLSTYPPTRESYGTRTLTEYFESPRWGAWWANQTKDLTPVNSEWLGE